MNDQGYSLDGRIPVLDGDNGKKLRMGVDHCGLPQFYVRSRADLESHTENRGSWFLLIHPDRLAKGIVPGRYRGRNQSGGDRDLIISQESPGLLRIRDEDPDGKHNSGRFIIVSEAAAINAWDYTMMQFRALKRLAEM